MRKVIEEINNEKLIYQLGYDLWKNKVYPCIEIYENDNLVCWCGLDTTDLGLFYFSSAYNSVCTNNIAIAIDEMFTKLRKIVDIPEKIEKRYEQIFLLYKLNDFKEFKR